METIVEYDVVVVGYGPTGMVAAALLGQRGHRVVVVERWPDLYGKPRATHIDGETARLISVTADAQRALADSWVVPHFYWYNGKGRLLTDVGLINTRRMIWDDHISVYQPSIDSALHERIESLPNVTLLRGLEAVSIAQDSGGVTLGMRPWRNAAGQPATGPSTVRGRYLIAADGSKSFVRQALGVERIDLGFHERWLNVDAERRRPLPEKFDENATAVLDPKRPHMFMPIGKQRQRFEWALRADESIEAMSQPEVAWRMLEEYHGLGPDDLTITRRIVYTFECRLAREWRHGRIFLAGDAAHTTPPTLGQGACSGMRDAANLAWKLDLVLRGLSDDALLDTYQQERLPHARSVLQASRALAQVANTTNRFKAALRDLLFTLKLTPKPSFPVLTDGVLARGADGRLLAQAGHLPPQGRLAVGGRTLRYDDHVGFGFALVSKPGLGRELAHETRRGLQLAGVRALTLAHAGAAAPAGSAGAGEEPVGDVDGVYARLLGELDADAALIRPDFVLYGHARASGLEGLAQGFLAGLRFQRPHARAA